MPPPMIATSQRDIGLQRLRRRAGYGAGARAPDRCEDRPGGSRPGSALGSISPVGSPILSAIAAPRWPSGLGRPVVVSWAVWCSSSALSSAPASTIVAESQSQVMKTTTVASEP